MHITGNELAMVSAGVAAIAVVASVWNNKSTNKSSLKATEESNENALAIAREERSSRRDDEAAELKRTIYARCIAALNALAMASIRAAEERRSLGRAADRVVAVSSQGIGAIQRTATEAEAERAAAELAAHSAGAEIDLVAPQLVMDLESKAHDKATGCAALTVEARDAFILARILLRLAMRLDLQGETDLKYSALYVAAEKEFDAMDRRDSGSNDRTLWR